MKVKAELKLSYDSWMKLMDYFVENGVEVISANARILKEDVTNRNEEKR